MRPLDFLRPPRSPDPLAHLRELARQAGGFRRRTHANSSTTRFVNAFGKALVILLALELVGVAAAVAFESLLTAALFLGGAIADAVTLILLSIFEERSHG